MQTESNKVDACGQIAPLPLIELKLALDSCRAGASVELLSDDPAIKQDVERFVEVSGHELLSAQDEGGLMRFVIKKRS